MASVKRKSKAKRKSKSRSDDLDESLDGSLQLFSTQTVQSALDEQPTAIPTAQTASTTTEPSDNALPVKVKPQRTRVQQQLEARGEIKPLLKAILTSCQGCLGQLKSLRQRVEDGQMETEHGVSFLDVRSSCWIVVVCQILRQVVSFLSCSWVSFTTFWLCRCILH